MQKIDFILLYSLKLKICFHKQKNKVQNKKEADITRYIIKNNTA